VLLTLTPQALTDTAAAVHEVNSRAFQPAAMQTAAAAAVGNGAGSGGGSTGGGGGGSGGHGGGGQMRRGRRMRQEVTLPLQLALCSLSHPTQHLQVCAAAMGV
jgi:hypothetical protein